LRIVSWHSKFVVVMLNKEYVVIFLLVNLYLLGNENIIVND